MDKTFYSLYFLASLSITAFFQNSGPWWLKVDEHRIEIGGNVSVLIPDKALLDPFYDSYVVHVADPDTADRSSVGNITLFVTFCNNLLLESVWLPPTEMYFLTANKGSRLPFNYYGGDTPVYSAGGDGSFIRISISAEATNYNGPTLSCGVQIFYFTSFTSYNNFVNMGSNITISNRTQHDFKCLPVGPSGLPSISSATFELVEHGYYRLVMLAELSISINSSVTGHLFHYNTSFLNPVFCDLNVNNCTLYLYSYIQLPDIKFKADLASDSFCSLVLADEYTTVVLESITQLKLLNYAVVRKIQFVVSFVTVFFFFARLCRLKGIHNIDIN